MQQFFLVVKVNYLFAFNVIKQNVYIDEHHKNQKIVEKGSNGAHRKICLLFASDDICWLTIAVKILNVSNLGFLLMKNSNTISLSVNVTTFVVS